MIVDGQPISCIAIGASAGGVDAINSIVRAFGGPLQVPVIVTLHVKPHSTFIHEAFRLPYGGVLIKEAEDKEQLLPGVIYFAPSDYHLLMESNGTLSLSSEDPVCFSRPSIDVMFESASLVYGKRVLGILLTGANHDGAAGLKSIHEGGGLTFVQDPTEAFASTMPKSALALFKPSRVLTLTNLSQILNGHKLAKELKF